MYSKKHFGKQVYWEEYYHANKDSFEWYHNYKFMRDIVSQYIQEPKETKMLNVGCGISKLPEELYNDGFRDIISIDFIDEVVTEMRQKFNEKMPKGFLFLKMDALDMDFTDQVFSAAVDKGTLDSVFSGFRSTQNAHKYLSEIYRVLDNNGIFFCLSYREPKERIRFFERFDWKVKVHKIYRPIFKSDIKYIKKEYVSKEVARDIEKQHEIELTLDDIPKENDENDEIYVKILNEFEEEKRQKQREREALIPREVESFYMYVCLKGEHPDDVLPSTVQEIELQVEAEEKGQEEEAEEEEKEPSYQLPALTDEDDESGVGTQSDIEDDN